jgi:hypothetical protein
VKTDERLEETQRLHWEIQSLRAVGLGMSRAARSKYRDMARLRDALARDLFAAGNADGWIDLLAAITAWGNAGDRRKAVSLLDEARELASERPFIDKMDRQLDELGQWLQSQPDVPSLADFAQPLPPLRVAA